MKPCKHCSKPFEITDADRKFYDRISVLEPTWCPECRVMRRVAWRNERFLYKRRCSLTGKDIISQYSPDVPFPVYDVEVFYSDKWTAPEMEYDPTKPFFEQLQKLLIKTPRNARLSDLRSIENNSVYQNAASRNKNCYLMFVSGDNENCLYGHSVDYCKDSIDNLYLKNSELCYECTDCLDCFSLFFSQNCRNCSSSYFLLDCRGCTDCFGCVGLRNKQYCWFNEQLTKEEYQRRLHDEFSSLTIAKFRAHLAEFKMKFPRRFAEIQNSENCVGDFIYDSSNVRDRFFMYGCQDCRYCFKMFKTKDCYDINDWGDPGELCYECMTVGPNVYKVLFSNNCWTNCSEVYYSDSCTSCRNIFGCTGIRNKEYCILNKQYSKQEYVDLTARIIAKMKQDGEFGEFFPLVLSPFGYNETGAQDYRPMTKEQVVVNGWKWQDKLPHTTGLETAKLSEVPEDIAKVKDDLVNQILACADCGKNYKIVKTELAFYRKMNLPVPRQCIDCRYRTRLALRNPRTLWHRQCTCELKTHRHAARCPTEFETTYAPERPEKVFCEQCYQSEVS